MEDFFGGSLLIKDAFSSTLTKFGNAIDSSSNKFRAFTTAIGESERANRQANQNMKNQIAQLSQDYTKQGYTMGQALRKATSEVSKEAPKSGSTWIDAFGKIKQVGTDAFGGIANKVQSFSNSTLGTITKISGGLLSLEAAKKSLETGFKTGMEYQNLRLVLDNLYKNPKIGAEKFKMGTDFAANSMWQEKDVIKSLSMLKGSDLDDSKSALTEMSDLGSYAKAMGVGDISTATRAYSEMMMGRWNMMTMDLAINREEVEKYAKDHNMKAFDNKNGHVTDKSALAEAFKGYIDNRGLTGLTEKMGQTATGKLSTLKDNVQKSLAELVGISNTGEVKDGSLFDRFTKGVGDMTTKIQQASESGKLEKFADGLSSLGGAISSAFGFIVDHPEIGSTLLKVSVGLWGLSKISGVVSSISSLVGLFGSGGALAGLVPILAPIAPYVLAIGGAFELLSSALSPDGLLNQGIGWLLGELFGDDIKKGWEEDTKAMNDFFDEAKHGWLMMLGFEKPEDVFKNNTTTNNDNNWYGGPDGKTLIKDDNYKTASDMANNGSISKDSSGGYSNKNEVNVNIAKVEKDVDIDKIGDALVKKIDKYSQTRNNLEY